MRNLNSVFGLNFLTKIFNSTRFNLLVLISLFLILNVFLFSKIGLKVANDSPRYLDYADQMIEKGFYFDPHEFWYIAYPSFLIGIGRIDPSVEAIVLAQYLFSIIGIISLYFASLKLFNSKSSSFLASLLMILFFEISIYNSYILTESLYLSMICMSLFILSFWYKKEFETWTIFLGPIVLIFTMMMKPTGIALLGAILGYCFIVKFKQIKSNLWRVAFILIISFPFLFLVNKMLTTFGFMNDYQRGELIFGMFQYPDSEYYTTLTIERPETLYFPDDSYPPLLRLVLFIINHPIYWTKLFLGKLFFFFAHIRPFWSTWHNLFSLLFLIPIYSMYLKGMINKVIPKEIKLFSLAYIGIHAVSVGLLTDDWDGRFLLPVLPVIFLVAGNVKK